MSGSSDEARGPDAAEGASEDAIRALLGRLGRPHPSGGTVIERAALMAEGAHFDVTIAWILAHGGKPEAALAAAPGRGLHEARTDAAGRIGGSGTPRRFVLPAGALTS
jgi:hypothetical protein